jgi:Ca2+-binding EF-hand superfamily protein
LRSRIHRSAADMGCNGSKQASKPQVEEVKAALVLTEVSAEERALKQLKIIFDSIDANKDGNVSKAELVAALEKDASIGALIKDAGLNQKYNALEQLRTSKDGRVTWEEFLANLREAAKKEVLETGEVQGIELAADEKALQQLKKLYDSLDSNKDGAVSRGELAAGMEKEAGLGQLIKEANFNPDYYVLEQLDTNEDGKITWDEFEAHLRQAAKEEVKELGEVAAVHKIEEEERLEADTKAAESEKDGVVGPMPWCGCGA